MPAGILRMDLTIFFSCFLIDFKLLGNFDISGEVAAFPRCFSILIGFYLVNIWFKQYKNIGKFHCKYDWIRWKSRGEKTEAQIHGVKITRLTD